MTRPHDGPGEVLIVPYDDPDMVIRGTLTTAEAGEVVRGYDEDLEPVGEASHSWARRGFYVDDMDEVCTGGLYYRDGYAGQRGAFAVTVIETRRVE